MSFGTLTARAFARSRWPGNILALVVLLTLLLSSFLPLFSFSEPAVAQAAVSDTDTSTQLANNWLAKVGPRTTVTVVGDGSAASCNEANLRNAIGNAGNITFNCPPNTVITVASQLSIGNLATTIDGANNGHPVTLSGGGTTRILVTSPNSVATLANLTLTNGYDNTNNGGGAIYTSGNLTLINTTVTANTSISNIYLVTNNGGGIFVNSGSLALSYSTVSANTATHTGSYYLSYGGGIFINSGNVSLSHTTITSNVIGAADGGYGGGIYMNAGVLSLSHTNIVSNTTIHGGNGGGIYIKGGSVTLNDQSSIASNTLPYLAAGNPCGYGGGIDIVGGKLDGQQ